MITYVFSEAEQDRYNRFKRLLPWVRYHPYLGIGSCSTYDECYDLDHDLFAFLLDVYFDAKSDSGALMTIAQIKVALVKDEIEWWSEQGIDFLHDKHKWTKPE